MWNGVFVEAQMYKRCWGAQQNVLNWILKIFFSFFFFSINSLQTELNNIFMLRKQLEEDVLANRNLQKVLEDQIKDIKNQQGLYTCTAHPFSWSSCAKKPWFYYSQCAGMEKKHLRVEKVVKNFLSALYTEYYLGNL